jgi:hypothetical protein
METILKLNDTQHYGFIAKLSVTAMLLLGAIMISVVTLCANIHRVVLPNYYDDIIILSLIY